MGVKSRETFPLTPPPPFFCTGSGWTVRSRTWRSLDLTGTVHPAHPWTQPTSVRSGDASKVLWIFNYVNNCTIYQIVLYTINMIHEQYNIPDDNKTYFFTDTRGYIFVLVVYLSSARGHTSYHYLYSPSVSCIFINEGYLFLWHRKMIFLVQHKRWKRYIN